MIIFDQMTFEYGFLIRTVVMATESPPQGLNIELKNEFDYLWIQFSICMFKKSVGIVC